MGYNSKDMRKEFFDGVQIAPKSKNSEFSKMMLAFDRVEYASSEFGDSHDYTIRSISILEKWQMIWATKSVAISIIPRDSRKEKFGEELDECEKEINNIINNAT